MSFTVPPLPPMPRPGRFTRAAPNVANGTLARLSTEVPRVPWDKFVPTMDWRRGEHVTLVGPTGQGKTTLMMNLLPLRPFVVVLATKPRDDTMNKLIRSGYVRQSAWRSTDPVDTPRRVLWPDATDMDSTSVQRAVFRDAFQRIYREGNWTVALDEFWYLVNELKLAHEVRVLLLQGRSLGISVLVSMQRPKNVPLEAYDQATHLFVWRDNDRDNLDRLAEINTRSSDLIRAVVPNLERFQVLYVNTRTGAMLRTRVPPLEGSMA